MRQGFRLLALLFVLAGFCVGCGGGNGKNVTANTKDGGPGKPQPVGTGQQR